MRGLATRFSEAELGVRGLLEITLNMGVSSSCVLFFFSTFGGPTSARV